MANKDVRSSIQLTNYKHFMRQINTSYFNSIPHTSNQHSVAEPLSSRRSVVLYDITAVLDMGHLPSSPSSLPSVLLTLLRRLLGCNEDSCGLLDPVRASERVELGCCIIWSII